MKMKFTKKIATILLSVCLIVPCFSVMALAANGVIFFSDLETSVGDEFTITGTAVVSGDVIGDATIHMTYDPSYMRFEEGDGVNADTDGNLTFKGSGDGSSDRIEFTMKFQALQEGSTRLEQGDATVTDSAGSSVACEEGYADVTIGAGDPSKIKDVASGTSVTIDGQEYTLSGDFSDSMIPAGFTAGEITYNDSTYKGAVQEKTGLQMAYLVDGDGKGDFWNEKNWRNRKFYPFLEEIVIQPNPYDENGKRKPEFTGKLATYTPYTTRHTYASLCDRAGVNKDILKRAVGHTPKSQTLDEVYLHPKATQMIEAFDKANQLVNDEVLTLPEE